MTKRQRGRLVRAVARIVRHAFRVAEDDVLVRAGLRRRSKFKGQTAGRR